MSETLSFPLYLSSATGAPRSISNADLANIRYLIDWDTFFNQQNYNYRSCRIRFKFLAEPSGGTTAAYTFSPSNFTGVVVANGLPSVAANPFGGTVLGMIGVDALSYLSFNTVIPTNILSGEDLTSGAGQNILIPTGTKELNIQLWDNRYGTSSGVLLSAIDPTNIPLNTWNLIIMFDLYDPIM